MFGNIDQCLPGSGDSNVTRARHAEEVAKSVDVLLLLVDTIRVTTDDDLIKRARGAMDTHGVENVKIITTKIDVSMSTLLAKPR